MIDLDQLEQAAKQATPGPWKAEIFLIRRGTTVRHSVWSNVLVATAESKSVDDGGHDAQFIAAANPAVTLALIARLRAAEALLTEFVADWEDGADFDHRQLRGYVNAARAILPPPADA